MTISSVGSSSGASNSEITTLQKQLKTDQKTLSDDETKKAQAATIAADQARVLADQQSIAQAQVKAKKEAASGSSSEPASPGGVDVSV